MEVKHECLSCFLRVCMKKATTTESKLLPLFAALASRCQKQARVVSEASRQLSRSHGFHDLVESFSLSMGLEAQKVFELELTDAERKALLDEAQINLNYTWIAVPQEDWPMLKGHRLLTDARERFRDDPAALKAWYFDRLDEENKKAATSVHTCSDL